MSNLLRTAALLEKIAVTAGQLATWLAPILMLVIVIDVLARQFFVIGSTALQELQWHLHGALFLLCLGFVYLRNAHVRIELFHDRLSEKRKAWLELIGTVLFLLPYAGVLIYFDAIFAYRSFIEGEVSSAMTGLSDRWIIKSVIGAGLFLLVLAGLSVAIRCALYLLNTGHSPPWPEEEEGDTALS